MTIAPRTLPWVLEKIKPSPPTSSPPPTGQQVHLHGKIDRVDFDDKKNHFVVADYKLTAKSLSLARVYHGLSLQLLTYLLVIQANAAELTGTELTPAAAFLLQLLRSPQSVSHPAEAMPPDDPDFPLQVKPRGLIHDQSVASLETRLGRWLLQSSQRLPQKRRTIWLPR